jgi:hypothetical protein
LPCKKLKIPEHEKKKKQQEKAIARDISDKVLLFKIYKECLKVKNEEITQFKNGPKTLTKTSPNVYRWQISR